MPDAEEFRVENARIFKKNFSGRGDTFNAEGTKTFLVALDMDEALAMKADGWNVKIPEPDEDKDPFISVKLGYTGYKDPLVVLITGKGRQYLTEKTVHILDQLNFSKVDIECNAYNYNSPRTGTGVKAYLATMFATVQESYLMQKYGMTFDHVEEPEEEG